MKKMVALFDKKRRKGSPSSMIKTIVTQLMVAVIMALGADTADTNYVFSPCNDAKVQKKDGFTFGLAFSSKDNFFLDKVQLSPCDKRLSLSNKGAQLALFRPRVDELSLLTLNGSGGSFDPAKTGGFMVAFAGRKYAARSQPVFIADDSHTIISLTLVLEFQKGTLQNLHWKSFGCNECKGGSVCLNTTDCGVPTSKCRSRGGPIDCSVSIQVAFSGTDKNLDALNSWYEVKNLRQYSLVGLFSDLRDSITSPINGLF